MYIGLWIVELDVVFERCVVRYVNIYSVFRFFYYEKYREWRVFWGCCCDNCRSIVKMVLKY